MDLSTVFAVLVGVGFFALIILVVVRMSRKKPGRMLIEDDHDEAPTPPRKVEAGRTGKAAPRPAAAPEPARKPEVPARKAPEAKEPTPPPPKPLVFPLPAARSLQEGLERTRKEGFVARLLDAFKKGEVDDAIVAQAEEALLTADIGVKTATALVEALRSEFHALPGELGPQVMTFMRDRTLDMLSGLSHGAPDLAGIKAPAVIMVIGVNGTGKTTTIGKMAKWYKDRGLKVLLAAGDTYRAAGMDQLAIWGERVGVPVVVGNPGQDPASVMFDAGKKAVEEGMDLLIADTAGRLHTNVNLVDELKKVHRVLGKSVPGAPHEVILLLDSTMGQNAVRQADVFRQAVDVTGIALAKLDGTAKGGVVLSIARDMNLPIRFVGVGESVDDLRQFDSREFVDALFRAD